LIPDEEIKQLAEAIKDCVNKDGSGGETALTVKWATIIGSGVVILMALFGYLFANISIHSTKLAALEIKFEYIQSSITKLATINESQTSLLQDIRLDQMRREKAEGKK